MATGKQLMKEIYDQFLLCKICFEIYRRPKTLSCLHTFCADCLESHADAEYERSYRYMLYNRSVTCPICRKKTEVPTGGIRRLPDNFLVANLADVVSRRKPTEFQECEICKPDIPSKHKQAKSKCLDCGKLLCKNCADLHLKTKVTQNHSVFDIEVERDIECKVHQDEVVRFYCEPCEQCICVICTFQEHKGHEISSFSEGMQKYQKSLDSIITMCRDRIADVKQQIDLISNCEAVIKNAEEQIRDMAINSITDIRKNERKLVNNLHDVYGEDTFEFLKEKQPLQEKLENLQSTCNLTDIITRDKSLELLLLRKEIQDKVNGLLGNELNNPPANVMKQVKFIPGRLEFGYLDIRGQTSEGKDELPTIKISTPPPSWPPDMESVYSQTDDVIIVNNKGNPTEESVLKTAAVTETKNSPLPQNKITQTLLIQTTDSFTTPLMPPSPKIRSRFTMTSPINVQNCQTMTLPPTTCQVRTQTLPVPTMDTSINTNCFDNDYNNQTSTKSKCTNTPSSPKCERSTLTIMKKHTDQVTDTVGLVCFKDQQTGMFTTTFKSQVSMTDPTVTNNQSTLTEQATPVDKYTITAKTMTLDRPTMTDTVSTFETGVNVRVLGNDKMTSTRNIVTTDSCFGENTVTTLTKSVETPWTNFYLRPETKDSFTMFDVVQLRETGCNTATEFFNNKTVCDKVTFTEPPLNIQTDTCTSGTPVRGVELMDCSTETDILGEIMKLEETKDVKLQNLIEKCLLSGITCEMISELLLRNEAEKREIYTSNDEFAQQQSQLCVNSLNATAVEMKTTATNTTTLDNNNDICDASANKLLKNDNSVTERNSIDTETTVNSIVHSCNVTTNTDIPLDLHAISNTSADLTADSNLIQVQQSPLNGSFKMVNMETRMDTNVNEQSDVVRMESQIDPDVKLYKENETSSGHYVMYCDKDCETDNILRDNASETVAAPTVTETGTNTFLETKEIGVLKRPHSVSKGCSTKKLKTSSKGTETYSSCIVMLHKECNTHTTSETVDTASDPIKFSCVSKTQGTSTINIVLKDSSCSPVTLEFTERASSPVLTQRLVNRESSPIRQPVSEASIDVKPSTKENSTETDTVMLQDTGVSPFKIHKSNKSVSPIPNLVPKANSGTSTDEVRCESRALSPIRQRTVTCGVNTPTKTYITKGLSPIKFKGNDVAILTKPSTVTRDTGTDIVKTKETGTDTKRPRTVNRSIGMPQVHYAEKHTATPQICTINKMISTDHISCIDKQTMTYDITSTYMDSIPLPQPITVNRGTNTPFVTMSSKQTSPERSEYVEKASSPVRVIMLNKGVMASKAELVQPKEKFHSPGLQTKPLRPIADSPKSNLESIEELRESDEEFLSKEIQTETPPRSPRVSFGRKAISALDLTQTSLPLTHKENFVLSAPRIGKKVSHESTFSPFRHGNTKLICKVETATNTKGIGQESRGTSTPPIEMEDKAVCTEAIHVTKDDKMAACISKLQTVKQRLEQQQQQQPVYVQAPTKNQGLSKSVEEHSAASPTVTKTITMSKSLGDSGSSSELRSSTSISGSKTSLRCSNTEKSTTQIEKSRRLTSSVKLPTPSSMAEVNLEPLVSPQLLRRTLIKQDSSDDSEDSHFRLKHSLARKKKPALAQLLERSSSLPEQDSPPFAIPKPKLKAVIPQVIPKLNVQEMPSSRSSRKTDTAAQTPIIMKGRHRKSSPVAMGTRIRPILAGLPAFGAANQPSILPNNPEKQRARQERIAKLRKEKQGLCDNKPPPSSALTKTTKKVSVRGSKSRTGTTPSVLQEDSSSSS